MRKFALIWSACAVLAMTTLARAQQTDFGVGAGILFSPKNSSASQGFIAPPEKGGLYPGASFVHILKDHKYGYAAEFAYAYKKQSYNGFQLYRPIIYDVNAVFMQHLANRTDAEVMAGVGGQTLLFYNQFSTCTFASGCSVHIDGNQFLFQIGAGFRYTLWRHLFVRPEAHLYHIVSNSSFSSDNVLRIGASVGYTFRPKPPAAK